MRDGSLGVRIGGRSGSSGVGVSGRSGSSGLGGVLRHLDADDGGLRIVHVELGAFRQYDVLEQHLGAVGQAVNVDHDALGQVGDIGADLELLQVDERDGGTLRRALDEHRHLDVDLRRP